MLITDKAASRWFIDCSHLKNIQRFGPMIMSFEDAEKITTPVFGTENGHFVVLGNHALVAGEGKAFCLAVLPSQPHKTRPCQEGPEENSKTPAELRGE